MSQMGKEKRVEFARKMQANYSPSVWTDTYRLLLRWSFLCLQDELHGSSVSSQRKGMAKEIRRSNARVFG